MPSLLTAKTNPGAGTGRAITPEAILLTRRNRGLKPPRRVGGPPLS
jgi:hypothetical protein